MMEGTSLDFGRICEPGTRELRTPEWAELVARFGAARELRAGLRRSLPRDAGSFAHFANRAGGSVNANALSVNHADLADGKTVAAETVVQAAPEKGKSLTGDREL